jgi:hypothetical protein
VYPATIRSTGPAEDSGGIYGYELICAASDPENPDHADAVAELSRVCGEIDDPEAMRATPFDIDEVLAGPTPIADNPELAAKIAVANTGYGTAAAIFC